MLDPESLAADVQRNCHISDAQFAGNYTLCIFLLKMREYYRWEQGIPLSQPLPKTPLGNWLVAREESWDELEYENFSTLKINGESFGPFDNKAINQHLIPEGYVYSGGYGLYHKPCFFLARLDKLERKNGTMLHIASKELARDLAAPPAMLQGKDIFIRRESLRRFIWEKIEEQSQHKSTQTPMARALSHYENLDIESTLDRMTENEVETLILHETGEDMAYELIGDEWEQLLLSLPRSRSEFLLRAVRDNFADCASTLPELIKRDNVTALHFYFANFTGMRKEIFPAASNAYHHWLDSGSFSRLLAACREGQQHWQQAMQKILKTFQSQPGQLTADIENICQPL